MTQKEQRRLSITIQKYCLSYIPAYSKSFFPRGNWGGASTPVIVRLLLMQQLFPGATPLLFLRLMLSIIVLGIEK